MTGEGFGAALLRRASAIGKRRSARIAALLAARIAHDIEGVSARHEGGAVRLRGRGLARRRANDARLRSIGRLVR